MVNYLDKTIKVTEATKKRLDIKKIHPREPYDELINRILDIVDKKDEKQQRLDKT